MEGTRPALAGGAKSGGGGVQEDDEIPNSSPCTQSDD